MVVWCPAATACAATSAPISPPPTTTTRRVPDLEDGPERLGVVDRAKHERSAHTLDERDVPGAGAGRDHQTVEPKRRPVAQDDLTPGEIQPRGGLAESPDDVGRRAVDREVGTVRQSGEERLGEREAVVGPMVLAPDHGQLAVVPEVTERQCRPVPGERAADDHDPSHGLGGPQAQDVVSRRPAR